MTYPALQYLPIPESVARDARTKRTDAFGHAIGTANEIGPCRVCLRIPTVPEPLLLLSYRPLPDRNPYAEIGPVFIHERECRPYDRTGAFPEDFAGRELVVRAYDLDGRIASAVVTAPGKAEAAAAKYLEDPSISEVHVRHTSYTCFDFKIVRREG
jgi:hypothetical protein